MFSNKIVLGTLALLSLISVSEAQTVTPMEYTRDINAKNADILRAPTYTQQVSLASSGQSYQLSCPTQTVLGCFRVTTADYKVKANITGTGVPPTGTVSDGSAWPKNPVCWGWQDASGNAISSVNAWSATAGTEFQLDCYKTF